MLVDPQVGRLVADAQEVGCAVAGDVGELPAIVFGHLRDAGHVGGLGEDAEALVRGDEHAAIGRHDAREVGEAVAVDVGELDTRVAQAQARRGRGDGVGGGVTGGVVVAQPGPRVGVVVAQDVDAAIEVEIDERDILGREVEAQVQGDLRGGGKRGVAAGVGPEVPFARLREDVLYSVAGEISEAGGLVDRDGGRGDVGPCGGEVGAEALAVAPSAGRRVQEIGERVAVDVDPGAAVGGRIERGPVGQRGERRGIGPGRVGQVPGRERSAVGGDGLDAGEHAARREHVARVGQRGRAHGFAVDLGRYAGEAVAERHWKTWRARAGEVGARLVGQADGGVAVVPGDGCQERRVRAGDARVGKVDPVAVDVGDRGELEPEDVVAAGETGVRGEAEQVAGAVRGDRRHRAAGQLADQDWCALFDALAEDAGLGFD